MELNDPATGELPLGTNEMTGQWRISLFKRRTDRREAKPTKIRVKYDIKIVNTLRELRVDIAMSDRQHSVKIFRIFDESDFSSTQTKCEMAFNFIINEVAEYVRKMCEVGHYTL